MNTPDSAHVINIPADLGQQVCEIFRRLLGAMRTYELRPVEGPVSS